MGELVLIVKERQKAKGKKAKGKGQVSKGQI